MEPHERDYIRQHLPELIEYTQCNIYLLSYLWQSGVIDKSDVDYIKSKMHAGGSVDAAASLYKIIVTKIDGYDSLISALQETCQSGAARILNMGKMNWQQNHIFNNLEVLASTTSFDGGFLEKLREAGILTHNECLKLAPRNETEWETISKTLLYEMFIAKGIPFDKLIPILKNSQQSQPVSILQGANLFHRPTPVAQNAELPGGVNGVISLKISQTETYSDFLSKIPERILDFKNNHDSLPVSIKRPERKMEFEDYYNLPTGSKGYVLLINIISFKHPGLRYRRGANIDTQYMTQLWTGLGYTIYQTEELQRGNTDMSTKKEITDLLNEFKIKCNMTKPNSIIVFVGSHGQYDTICTSDPKPDLKNPNRKVVLKVFRDIVDEFNHAKCPGLEGKPKLFFINACQKFVPEEADESDSVHSVPYVDAQIWISQLPGYPSTRNIYRGSHFVYCLTYVLMNYSREKSFQNMMNLVKEMMKHIYKHKTDTSVGQLPVPTDYDLKPLHFFLDP